MYLRSTELRKVKSRDLKEICVVLDSLDSWKALMGKIPQNLESERFIPKYTCEHLNIIENEGKYPSSPTKALLADWGTSGVRRPTLETLLKLLINNDLFRAADTVAVNLLGGI